MIFFILIFFVQSCLWEYEDMTLYPTNGEYFEYPMSSLIQNYDNHKLIYHYEPSVPNVQITNIVNEITHIEGDEFISVSSNQTHFVTITKENDVILYQWQNLNIQQYGQQVKIEERYKCYNIIFFADVDVLLDCYAEEHFYLLQLMNTSLNIVYSIQANKPIKSQMQGIYNESKTFLIYAQYYQNLSIITLFSSQFKNLTFYQDQFIQIGIPLRENPYIYILYKQYIKQFIITQNNTFQQTQIFKKNNEMEADNFQVYYNYQDYSQCDQILFNYYYNYYIDEYLGCQNQMIEFYNFNTIDIIKKSKLIQSFLNNQFVVIQSELHLTIYKQQEYFSIGQIVINNNTQIYLNTQDNYLFTFNKQIIVYELKIPQIQINLTDQQVQGITYDIKIYAKLYNLTFAGICKMFMSITILDQNDTNIYVMFNKNFNQYRSITGNEINEQIFVGYSGKLLQYTVNIDNKQFGQFNQTTYQEGLIYINQSFNLAQIQNPQYFIGVTNESIQILGLYPNDNYNSPETLMDINIYIQAQQLQVSDCYEQNCDLIIGVSDYDTIYLYQIYFFQETPYYPSEIKFEQQFQQFLVTFNNVITLYVNEEIQIMSLNFTDLIIINEPMINKLFKSDNQIIFNPIQIAVNTQSLSSCLFINNINNVIIISIGNSNMPIPISIIEVKFQIKQINIVNQNLILSYICNKNQDLCFQVWSIQNLKFPFFMRNMTCVDYNNQLQILSDNLFFYVQFSNYTVHVYNPQLPQHMSLYYQLILSSKLICTGTVQSYKFYLNYYSFLYFETFINSLSAEQCFQLLVNQSLNFSRSYPQMIYNYTVSSLLNVTANQSTPNQSLTYLSNFTYFQTKTKITVGLLIQDLNLNDRTLTIPMNIILDRQASLCYFPKSSDVDKIDKVDQSDQQYFTNDECNLTNFGYFTKNIDLNYTQVTAVNNKFFILQNNSVIDIYNQYFEFLNFYDYYDLNFTECLKSTSYNLNLSSICQNDTAQYWLTIQFDSNGNFINRSLVQIPYKFTYITKISNIATLNFILGSYLQKNTYHKGLYLLNPLNNTMQQLDYQNREYEITIDFSVALFNSGLDMNQSDLVLIIYVDNQGIVKYIYLFFNNNSITLSDTQELIWDGFYYAQILILQIIDKQIYILFTSTEGFGQLKYYKLSQNQLNLLNLITTIPAYEYDDFVQIPNSVYSNGFLLQQFKQGNTYIIGVYYIPNLLINNLEEPILMLGQLNSTSSEYALITNIEDRNATCLALNNGSVLYYPIYTRTLKCHYRQDRNTVHVNITCKNDFSNGSYEITFILPQLHELSRRWIYSLITIIMFQLIGFYILVKYRMRNIGYINTEIEL